MNNSNKSHNIDSKITIKLFGNIDYSKIIFPTIVLLCAAIISRLPYEFHRLLFSTGKLGAIDLIQRYEEVKIWFSGEHVYSILNSAVYPPASYLIMWPFMGFDSWELVRWIWAISSIIFLAIFIKIILKDNSINSPLSKTFWTLFIIAHYSTGITIGNGQFTIHLMAAFVACITLISSRQSEWNKSILGGLLAALSLIKPTVALPFMWLVLFIPNNIYPALATVLIYIFIAIVASSFQQQGIFELHLDWFSLGMEGASWSSKSSIVNYDSNLLLGKDIGYGDIHSLLGAVDMSNLALPVSLIILALLGLWIYFHRHCNIWLLMGVTAIISRIWTYHRVYDDMLIILAIFAVLSILRNKINLEREKLGRFLLVTLIISSLVPASLRLLPSPWDLFFKLGQLTLWMSTLLYLVNSASKEKRDTANLYNYKIHNFRSSL